jgi:protocatechuate 3,4-dioxygenase beta subunit
MKQAQPFLRTRRDILWAGLMAPVALIFAPSRPAPWHGMAGALAGEAMLAPTPACGEADEPSPRQTEGPYYKRHSPERQTLIEPGVAGTPLSLSGQVLSRRCQPIARALLDFWQADDEGAYDNKGYRLRGHQFADEAGRYRLETIVPGLYPGRTRHIHVKVQAPHNPVLTSQLYFPGEPSNRRDRLFRPELLVKVEETPGGQRAVFDFVLDVA